MYLPTTMNSLCKNFLALVSQLKALGSLSRSDCYQQTVYGESGWRYLRFSDLNVSAFSMVGLASFHDITFEIIHRFLGKFGHRWVPRTTRGFSLGIPSRAFGQPKATCNVCLNRGR